MHLQDTANCELPSQEPGSILHWSDIALVSGGHPEGAVMEPVLKASIPEIKVCQFRPHHRNNLSNEFRCFSSYGGGLLGIDQDS